MHSIPHAARFANRQIANNGFGLDGDEEYFSTDT